jgi:hypothetical protein
MNARRLVVPLLLLAGSAFAEEVERLWGGGIAAQVNPAGLRLDLHGGLRVGLFGSTNPLVKDAHVAVGFTEQLSPAYNRVGVHVVVSPLSILDLEAGADGFGYFGTFGHLVGFPSYDSDFGDDARRAIRDQAVARVGARLYLSPTLKFKVGRVSLRLSADFDWWRTHNAPRNFYYEPYSGTLLDAQGDALVSGGNLLLVDLQSDRPGHLQAGLFHEYLDVYAAPQNRKQRIGPIVALKLRDRRFGLPAPLLYAGMLGYFESRDRGGLSGFVSLSFGR